MSDDSHSRHEVDGALMATATAFRPERTSSNSFSSAGYALLRIVFDIVALYLAVRGISLSKAF